MGKLKRAIYYLIHNKSQFLYSSVTNLNFLFPDKLYLQLKYRLLFGKWINWNNPQSFNEKLQWLKVFNRKSEYTSMVDKYEVKRYISNLIGEEYVIPLLGVWDRFDDIDFDLLPDQFVLKTTHSGGSTGVIICKDKRMFDIQKAKAATEYSLKSNVYKTLREWPYKDVKPRIIAEEYMSDGVHSVLLDYKFFCFNGDPKVMLVATGRDESVCFDYFDMEFNHLPFQQGGPNSSQSISRPENLDEMIRLVKILAKDIPHVRIDLYDVNGRIYFGEFTFFDSSGMSKFEPEEWDYILGSYIKLPGKTR